MAGWGGGGVGSIGRALIVAAALALVGLMAPAALARPLRAAGGAVRSDALPPVNTENGCEFIAEPGGRRLHAALPGRLLHGRRPDQPHRPAGALQRRNDARERRTGTTSKPPPTTPRTASAPGSVILVKVPGINTAADVRASKAVPINHIGQYNAGQRPGGRDRRPDGQTLADLGRDRLERAGPGQRACSRSIRRSTSPPGTATSWRCATSRTRPTNRSKRRSASATTATTSPANRKRSTPAAPTSKNCSRNSKAAGHPALEPVPGVGLHGRQRRQQHRTRARHAQRRLRPARRHQPRRRHPPGRLAQPSRSRTSKTNPTPGKSPGA